MIDFVNNLLNKIFGNKSDKDIDLIRPLVAEMNDHFSNVTLLTDDGLLEYIS